MSLAFGGCATVPVVAEPGTALLGAVPASVAVVGWGLALAAAALAFYLAARARRRLSETDAALADLQQRHHHLQERWQAVAENSPDYILLLDPDGTIRFVNRMRPGVSREAVIGRPVYQFAREDQRPLLRAALEAVVSTGEVRAVELVSQTADGANPLYEARFAPVRQDGKVIAIMAISHDITQERRVERQLRQALKMEAIGRLAGGVAHDFNNILTVIQCNALLTREGLPADAPVLTELDEILRAAERAAHLTQQLLAFSRRQIIKPVAMDLRTSVTNITRMLTRVIGESIQLEVRQAPESLPVRADPGQVEQVVMNLVLNARDAMPRGGRLVLETARVSLCDDFEHRHGIIRKGDYVTVVVRDTGSGIPEEVITEIFEPYFTTKEIGKGAGLGLSMVYGILEQHHGGVVCDSVVGQGTTFSVFLPLDVMPPGAEAAPATTTPSRTPLPRIRTILVVEDEISVRTITCRLLEKEGYNVLVAADGTEALKLVESYREPVHLLFTDVVMPGTNGAELARLIRAQRPELKVLYTSGYTDSVVIRHGVEAQNLEFLHKPYTSQELLDAIRKVLFGHA